MHGRKYQVAIQSSKYREQHPMSVIQENYTADTQSESGRKPVLKPERMGITMMSNSVRKFSKPVQLVMDLFLGSLSTANDCVQQEKLRHFVGCGKAVRYSDN